MRAGAEKFISRALFVIRLAVFVLAPYFATTELYTFVAPAVYMVILSTWIAELAIGRTIWISVQWKLLLGYLAFALGMIMLNRFQIGVGTESLTIAWISPIVLIALSSDAIANSRRWQVLLPAMVVIWLLCVIGVKFTPYLDLGYHFQGLYAIFLYSFIGALAAAARLFFVRTKHIIHTSLDYPPIRLEILSMGMKRPLAIGIKRKTDPAIGVNRPAQ